MAEFNAAKLSSVSIWRDSAYPTTLRDQASRITPRYTNPLATRDVGQIGDPDLVWTARCCVAVQVWIDGEGMIAVGGTDEALDALHRESLLAHDPGNPLVVDRPALGLELM